MPRKRKRPRFYVRAIIGSYVEADDAGAAIEHVTTKVGTRTPPENSDSIDSVEIGAIMLRDIVAVEQ